jgi:hypothetical protein
LTGGQQAVFQTNATDNLTLASADFTLAYAISPAGSPALNIRMPGATLASFGTILTQSTFNLVDTVFFRTVASTDGAGHPQDNAALPTAITARTYDAANNQSTPVNALIQAANIPLTGAGVTPLTHFTALQANGATFSNFQVSNAPTQISNCSPAVCPTPAHASTVVLTATANGTEQAGPPAFQFQNPFPRGVYFYYFDNGTGEWILVPGGVVPAPSVSDDITATTRTFTWTAAAWDPPLSLGSGGSIGVIAVGVNAAGDALVTAGNGNITLTNP